jgi:hypothetical protein
LGRRLGAFCHLLSIKSNFKVLQLFRKPLNLCQLLSTCRLNTSPHLSPSIKTFTPPTFLPLQLSPHQQSFSIIGPLTKVLLSTSRYIAVTQPIKYAKHKNSRRVCLTILLVWAISAAIGSPIVLGLNNTPDRLPDLCLFYNSDFIVYSSLSSFYIPCIIMVFLYWNIFKVSFHVFVFLLRLGAAVELFTTFRNFTTCFPPKFNFNLT